LLYPCGQSAQENLNEMRNISIPKVDENNKWSAHVSTCRGRNGALNIECAIIIYKDTIYFSPELLASLWILFELYFWQKNKHMSNRQAIETLSSRSNQ
jgi:hypothetical protein